MKPKERENEGGVGPPGLGNPTRSRYTFPFLILHWDSTVNVFPHLYFDNILANFFFSNKTSLFMYIPTGHSTRVPYMYKVCTIS